MSQKEDKKKLDESAENADIQTEEELSSETRTSKTSVLACRMPVDEIKAVEKAAAAIGESVSEYVRKALLMRREGPTPFRTVVSISIGNPYMQTDQNPFRARPSGIVESDSYPQNVQAHHLA